MLFITKEVSANHKILKKWNGRNRMFLLAWSQYLIIDEPDFYHQLSQKNCSRSALSVPVVLRIPISDREQNLVRMASAALAALSL